ncbi:hypothetical protein HRR83_004924 [Exophiala dermatitidis]|uniref:Soluble epoxide hydrolase n=2 Tax=Exophiala dermatitidis TaxID=5970 RepID=H6C3K2_EXODN|nr:soluble epoxide hydrolase [Exophiala dermatitidis NIH/UT8656]KAJ4517161.1 hypothetical protein HRR74_004911 [Exophiala dermatitidis]EHY58217.1 soluble epoxide hydrolase [Exophiala dermatitidis NIH/UT8656]KAJ4519661.1 hypothetical protein HRR73_003721 [Exophiala dermatitidis]KAJ4534539.1 hypothetical protein HRR76_006461 [Exophiala dermatitidis]KAJ4541526.1 hypothetical protein HRR78_007410 [Exophiala dermatitidis]
MPPDKIKVYNDPRVSLHSAHLNGITYGYLYSPAYASSSTSPNSSPTTSNSSPSPFTSTKPKRGTIFLVHGFPDLSMGWRYQIPYLTSLGLDVIAIDCIGYGRTDSPLFHLQSYTYRRVADDIAELARQLGLSSQGIILGGHDWGGAIVYRVAQYYPQLIRAVFSICTPYFPPSPTYEPLALLVRKRLPNFGYQLHFASGEIEANVQSRAEIRQFLNNMYGARTPEGTFAFHAEKGIDLAAQARVGKNKLLDDDEMDYYVAEYARHGLNGPLNWYRNREENFVNEWRDLFHHGAKNPQDVLRDTTIQQEVLFVLATRDQALKPFMADRMADRIPNLTRREVNASHWALWERPDECNRLIGDWLNEKVFVKDRVASKL